MDFSNEQKLIVTLLTEIHAALNIKNGIDPDFVQDKVCSGDTWALYMQYPGIFEKAPGLPANVKFVANVLDLFTRLERSYESLSAPEKAELEDQSPIHGKDVSFKGFDGNGGDRNGYSTTETFVNQMGRWSNFKGRSFNSHMPSSEIYDRMLNAYDSLNKNNTPWEFSVDEMAHILNAAIHPDNR